jgi:hypothetical protein
MQRLALCCILLCAMTAFLPLYADEPSAPRASLPVAGITTLGKTIRLEFTLSAEDFSETYSVVCASTKYAIHSGQSKEGESYAVDIKGNVTEGKAGGYYVSFKASLDRNEGSDGFDLAATGSAIMELGKSKKLSSLGIRFA